MNFEDHDVDWRIWCDEEKQNFVKIENCFSDCSCSDWHGRVTRRGTCEIIGICLAFHSNFLFSLSFFITGLMICRNARHLSETMVFKHRVKSLSDPSDYIQHFNALEHLDGKSVVTETQFSWWSIIDFKGKSFFILSTNLESAVMVIDFLFCIFNEGICWVIATNCSWYIDREHRIVLYLKALQSTQDPPQHRTIWWGETKVWLSFGNSTGFRIQSAFR